MIEYMYDSSGFIDIKAYSSDATVEELINIIIIFNYCIIFHRTSFTTDVFCAMDGAKSILIFAS